MIEFKASKKLHSSSGEMILNIDFQIEDRAFVTLYGESGSGKTTTLRILSGLEQPLQGFIKVNDEVWLDTTKGINLPPQKRKIGYVFQDYALFPNMSVRAHLNFALEKGQDKCIIEELLNAMELVQLQDVKPEKLSGGQKQRLALARALVRKPNILLLDEPMSSVDHDMRIKLQNYIIAAHRSYQLTTILVSHDIAEVYKMSDKVMMLEQGRITKQGTATDVFSSRLLSSGKYQFVGEILNIKKENIVCIVSVLIGNTIAKVIATEEEANEFTIGSKVLVVSKAFNPNLIKI